MTYQDFCKQLLVKYGAVPYPYFNESGYCNSITLNKSENEFLWIHHIDENIIAGLSNKQYNGEKYKPYQQANRLVYADPLEHLYAHMLICEDYCQDALNVLGELNGIYCNDPWTEEELRIGELYWPIEGMNIVKRLLGRSRSACQQKATVMGWKRELQWYEISENVKALYTYYESLGTDCIKYLTLEDTKANRACVAAKARALKLKCTKLIVPQDVDNFILQHPNMPIDELCRALPMQPRSRLLNRRAKLGVQAPFKSRYRAVRCIETGETFESITAARAIYGDVGQAIRTQGRCGGYHWEYVEEE